MTAEIDVPDFYRRQTSVVGSTMGTQPELERFVEPAAEGVIDPVIGGEYDLGSTAATFAEMATREVFGKLRVRP